MLPVFQCSVQYEESKLAFQLGKDYRCMISRYKRYGRGHFILQTVKSTITTEDVFEISF
jgi:hypothetical protein